MQNLIKIDSAGAALCMREKRRFRMGFFCLHIHLICLSVYLPIYPFFTTPTGHIFSAIFGVVLIMATLCNKEGHYIFARGFFLSIFFPRLISVATDWMSTILRHMAWH